MGTEVGVLSSCLWLGKAFPMEFLFNPVCSEISVIDRSLLYRGPTISYMAVDVFGKNSKKSSGIGSLLVGGSGHPNSIRKQFWVLLESKTKSFLYRIEIKLTL